MGARKYLLKTVRILADSQKTKFYFRPWASLKRFMRTSWAAKAKEKAQPVKVKNMFNVLVDKAYLSPLHYC